MTTQRKTTKDAAQERLDALKAGRAKTALDMVPGAMRVGLVALYDAEIERLEAALELAPPTVLDRLDAAYEQGERDGYARAKGHALGNEEQGLGGISSTKDTSADASLAAHATPAPVSCPTCGSKSPDGWQRDTFCSDPWHLPAKPEPNALPEEIDMLLHFVGIPYSAPGDREANIVRLLAAILAALAEKGRLG